MSKFDFKKVKEKVDVPEGETLQCVLLGVTGSGKSSACGTLPGKILWLYNSDYESHGPDYAHINSDSSKTHLHPLDLAYDPETGEKLSSGDQLDLLRHVLADTQNIASNFDAVVLDGATTLEHIYQNSPECLSKSTNNKGVLNKWDVFAHTAEFFNEVYSYIKLLTSKGVHSVVTCTGKYKAEDDGTVLFSPILQGVNVVIHFLSRFNDRVVTTRDKNGTFKFSLSESVEKKSGVNSVDCSPRVHPLKADAVPPEMSPDFSKVLALKRKEVVWDKKAGKVVKKG